MSEQTNMKYWPNKNEREAYEIKHFISAYKRMPHEREFVIVNKREKPDYIVEDTKTHEKFGVELTSVYLDDRSVPDVHRKPHDGPVHTPHDQNEISRYKERLLNAIEEKNNKARSYSKIHPLILSIYVNEYCAIHMSAKCEWEQFVKDNEVFFNNILFAELLFWNDPKDSVCSVRADQVAWVGRVAI